MKKCLSLILILAMLLSMTALAGAENSAALPAVGDTVEGFVVREIRAFPLVGGDAVLLSTSAPVLS